MILNDITTACASRRRGPDMASACSTICLTLLSRPFAPDEAVIVKPSTVVIALAPAMSDAAPGSPGDSALCPAADLSRLNREEGPGRAGLWVRTLLTGMIDDGLIDLGFPHRDLLGQTDLQVAAVSWLAHQQLFTRMVEQFGPDRVRTLDSATLMHDPTRSAVGAIRN